MLDGKKFDPFLMAESVLLMRSRGGGGGGGGQCRTACLEGPVGRPPATEAMLPSGTREHISCSTLMPLQILIKMSSRTCAYTSTLT